jgi:ribosomal-protein-alanine N-acetyltransferase
MARLKKTEQLPPQIRWLIRRDMPEVMEIENRSFQFPWSEEEFLCCLRQRNCIGTVYESTNGPIHGFMICELHTNTLRILNFAVAPEVRRTGVGRAMAKRLMDKLSQQKRHWIVLETRESNVAAQLFWSACGFRAERILSDFYDNGENAIHFSYCMPGLIPAHDGSNRISQYFDEV